jgi:hypothetical protein
MQANSNIKIKTKNPLTGDEHLYHAYYRNVTLSQVWQDREYKERIIMQSFSRLARKNFRKRVKQGRDIITKYNNNRISR